MEDTRKSPSKQRTRWDNLDARTRATPSVGRRIFLAALAMIVFLFLVGFWTEHAVRESLNRNLSTSVTALLNATVRAIQFWFDDMEKEVEAWARDPELLTGIQELVEAARTGASRDELLEAAHQEGIRRALRGPMAAEELLGFVIADLSGLVLAADEDDEVGLRIAPPAMEWLAYIARGRAYVTKPFHVRDLISGKEDLGRRVVAVSGAPIRDADGKVVAALAFVLDPRQDFNQLFAVGRMGDNGRTYAFDDRGVLLTVSLFEKQLKEIGLLPESPEPGSILQVQIRDPGGDLTRGFKPDGSLATRPLTRMAAAAVAGEDGVDMGGYRDFRGVTVVGAWQWVEAYDLGIATELDKENAFSALRQVQTAFWVLFGILATAMAGGLAVACLNQRLQRRIEEVQQLGQYTLEDKIGEGGMGVVYRARHAVLQRPTAVKLLKGREATPEAVARFEREVQVTSQLDHPNTVRIFDFGRTPERVFYYAMEYLDGLTLAEIIEDHEILFPPRVIHILRQVCASLREAHAIGLVHRDIKPLNIMLCMRGGEADVVKVLDFGLVKDLSRKDLTQLTAPDVLAGTPQYIAPERIRDPSVSDPRSDIYSFGAVGFALLTGQELFPGKSALEVCQQVLHAAPRRPSDCVEHEIPEELDQLIVDCLAKEPEERPRDVNGIIAVLERLAASHPWTREEGHAWWMGHFSRRQREPLEGKGVGTESDTDFYPDGAD